MKLNIYFSSIQFGPFLVKRSDEQTHGRVLRKEPALGPSCNWVTVRLHTLGAAVSEAVKLIVLCWVAHLSLNQTSVLFYPGCYQHNPDELHFREIRFTVNKSLSLSPVTSAGISSV